MSVIANTTVVSNFASVQRLDLLPLLWQKLYISTQVWSEIQAGLQQGYSFYSGIEQFIYPFSKTGHIHLIALHAEEEFRLFGQLSETLHSGEASSIAIAKHRQWTFLSDDKAARTQSKQLKVSVSGTVGLLIPLVKHNKLNVTEADDLLQKMIQLFADFILE
ncbi:hypothetical protein QUF63_03605 [Anaerolineales bacterium HSG25]|nr:hypothetical protein [Anaerolineales bacterium HSG25]